ncbi:BTB domain-containing protein [Cinnamomum micranthum f. kanehirae]|uniref:BTB domain-containing protein n=1 Tax=Cinnamomum micranthum f. kanehirae TaxID=337451 RepID=A0A3S3P6M1_9MAGN|nr:BTB domain-containing protein [Cinnamomum micranthum f. kanehirae]
MIQSQCQNPRSYGNPMKMALSSSSSSPCSSSSSSAQQNQQQQNQHQQSDNDRSSGELRALDCNLTSLCDHIQVEGFNSGAFSDVVVQAMGSTYRLHRLILSRSSYFRNMLHGPWKEASAPVVNLHIDDENVNTEAIAVSLAYLYGHHPKLNDNNAFRVLAAASFLDLQDLCAICTDFIISELWTSNFLAYQVFAESQDYGIHGERVRSACWGYLCQCGTMELREVLPKLSSQTLHALLTSDELWVPSEEKRFELALYTLLAKGAFFKVDHPEQASSSSEIGDNLEGHKAAHNILVELADCVVDYHTGISVSKPPHAQHEACSQTVSDSRYFHKMEQPASLNSPFTNSDTVRTSHAYVEVRNGIEASRMAENGDAMEGPSEESSCYHLNSSWLSRDQPRHCSSAPSSCNGAMPNDWGRCSVPPSWGGRIVGRRQVKNYAKGNSGIRGEEYDAFINIFEGGSLLYCNMSFEALLSVRKHLEELGFPCKAVNDGLWLQMLLSHRVQEIGAETCKNCCLTSIPCACRQSYGFSHGGTPTGYYRQEHDRNSAPGNVGNVYLADAQGEGNGLFGPVRVHVRGPIDGLAGLGRGTTFVPAAAWPPTRFVFSRVPFGLGNRNCQQSLAHDESEARVDPNGDLGDGLTALVGLSQGNNVIPIHTEQTFDPDLQNRITGASVSVPSSSGIPVQMLEPQEHALGLEWDNSEGSSISLDMKTPLRHFPPFRFGVEFEDVHRLTDGQVKHSPEVFYAGSLWKVSVQAFNDEDPQGRRTLGLFLHRRKAEMTDSVRKDHIYVDSREKVTARYQLICPSKREVMVFGSFKQAGTLLPKAPKGWGWRTALLFDELADLLQGGALRVAAVVQLV